MSNPTPIFNGWTRAASLIIGLVLGIISGAAGGLISTWVNASLIHVNKEDIAENKQDIRDLRQVLSEELRRAIDQHERAYHNDRH